jgi:hypothetical protein
MSKTIARNESGRFQRDDSVLRDAQIETLGILKRVAMMWELFPDMDGDERRVVADTTYTDISTLIQQLQQVDKQKGGSNVSG